MKTCLNCHKDNPLNNKFCHYCGVNLSELAIEDSTKKIVCDNCGSSNLPDVQFCTACGSPLADQKRKEELDSLHKYWYCEKDNVLMKETTSNHQFLISKDIDKSLQELVEKHKIRSEQKPLAEEIAQRVFEYDPKTNFPLLTRNRCPICMDDSLAPVYYQPRQEELSTSPSTMFSPSQYMRPEQRVTRTIPITTIHVERLTPMDMIQNLFQILKQYPQILVIIILIIFTEVVLSLAQIPRYDISSILVFFFPEAYPEQGPIHAFEVIVGIPTDLLIEGLFITLLLVVFKNKISISDEKHSPSSTGILSQGIHLFPKIITAKLLMDGITTAFLVIELCLVAIIMMSSIDPILAPLELFLFPLIFILAFSFILVGMLIVVFAYVYPSIVMAKMGPIDSIVRSWEFVKKYFWPTVVIVFLFTYVPSFGLSLIPPEIIPLGSENIILQIFEIGQLLCFVWGFEKIRVMQQKPDITEFPSKLHDQRSPTYLEIIKPYYYRSGNRAALRDRFIAFLVDSCIVGAFTYAICLGWLYQIGKDYIREGQSFGKGLMGLRVIDFHSGMPATIYQSFIRNCLCGCVDASCCCLATMIDEDGRRIGDHVAGTVVIKDL